uniref:Glycosyltransferase RgtA/B/C/D-like domain-containing protein n=1 Tax=Pseudothermotoga hypogea TaxID=57487 RepID=A0A832I789_9THEM
MNRKTLLVLLTVVVLSYVVTSIGFWMVEDTFSIAGRIFLYHTHRKLIEGVGPAPNQYRYVPYPLVEYFFKHSPIRWYSNTYVKLKQWLGFDAREIVKRNNQLSLNAHVPPEEREKMLTDVENFLREKLLEITKNPLTSNILLGILNNLGWRDWVKDPFNALEKISKELPSPIIDVFDNDSDLTKVVNGYATMRFTFTILLFLVLHAWMKFFVRDFTAYVSLFAYSIFLAFGYGDFAQQEFIISLLFFVAGLILIYRRKPWWIVLLLVIGQCFVRTDHALFTAVIYSLFNFSREKKKLLQQGVLVVIPVFMILVLSEVIFPKAEYYISAVMIMENVQDPWALVYPLFFFALPLFFVRKIRNNDFFRKTWLWMIPFIVMNFVMGCAREVRLYLPIMAYIFPMFWLGVESLYNRTEK